MDARAENGCARGRAARAARHSARTRQPIPPREVHGWRAGGGLEATRTHATAVALFRPARALARTCWAARRRAMAVDGATAKKARVEQAMRVHRLRPEAKLPVRGSKGAAGYDLAAAEPTTIAAGGRGIVKTVRLPPVCRDAAGLDRALACAASRTREPGPPLGARQPRAGAIGANCGSEKAQLRERARLRAALTPPRAPALAPIVMCCVLTALTATPLQGLAIAIPEGTYARIAPRSGLAVKKGINTGAGVVDYDYRGEVGVVLFNHGTEDFEVAAGDRVAQLILERIATPQVVEVAEGGLDETERGAGGYGSTGVSDAAPTAQ